MSSRAVIKRGSIVPIVNNTLAGVEVKFYYEDGKQVTNLEVWVRGRLTQVKDKYILPYGKEEESATIIACKEGFS